MYKGIDVSSYQGNIDWNRVKAAGVEFAILKVIRKDLQPDKQFENNWTGCVAAGVPIQGVYNYTYATTAAKAANDAKKVLEILGPDRHPMVWLDYEDKSLPTDKTAADIINAYGDVITAGGCRLASTVVCRIMTAIWTRSCRMSKRNTGKAGKHGTTKVMCR